jgi:hypothetical protein
MPARPASAVPLYTRSTVTLLVLTASLYVLLWGGYPDSVERFASNSTAAILGYWLRGR